jgi:hypothetical protein
VFAHGRIRIEEEAVHSFDDVAASLRIGEDSVA